MSASDGLTVTLPGGDELRCEPAARVDDIGAVPSPRGGPNGGRCRFGRLSSAERRRGTAVDLARAHGAVAVDAIPVAPGGKRTSPDLSTGTPSMFEPLGFVEVARRKPELPILRLRLR